MSFLKKPVLKFREDGTFRILQLTDMHLFDVEGRDRAAVDSACGLIEREKPDLIAFTGDISCDGERSVCTGRLDALLEKIDAFGVPYTYTLGNHESDVAPDGKSGRQFAIAETLEKHELSLFERGDEALGVGNYMVPVMSRDKSRMAWALYHLDCHSGIKYEFTPGQLTRRDSYILPGQTEWLEKTHRKLQSELGSVPAILFDHVPLAEFDDLWMFDGIWGDHGEMVCRAPVGEGLFGILLRLGDFRGVFAGHDHTNSFQGQLMGITLAYGRCSGNCRWALWPRPHALQSEARRHPPEGESPYRDYFVRGGRVIVLNEDTGRLEKTYVSLYDGTSGIGEYTPPAFDRFNYFIPSDGGRA